MRILRWHFYIEVLMTLKGIILFNLAFNEIYAFISIIAYEVNAHRFQISYKKIPELPGKYSKQI